MPGAEVRRYSSDRRGLALNLILGVVAGALAALAESLLLPIVVLAFFVGRLTDSYAAVGLVPAIGVGLWALARLPAAVVVGPQRRKQPWAVGALLVKAGATGLLAVVSFRVDPAQADAAADPLLRSFFLLWIAYALASGFGSLPTAALLAKVVPDERRALFYRQRAVWSGVAALVGGLVVAQVLRSGNPPFPRNYGLLFLAATVCQLAAAFFLSTLREPSRVGGGSPSAPAIVRAIPEALNDPSYRRFLLFRTLLSSSAIIDPFLIIFALSRLGVGVGAVGGYVVVFVLGRLLSTPVWATLGRRSGDKAILQVSAFLRLLPPLLALTLPYLGSIDLLRRPLFGGTIASAAFGAGFLALGAATAGQARGNFAYLSQVAAPRLRPTYAALTNGVLAIVAVAPVLGGAIVARSGYETLFLVAAAIGLLAVFASGALTDTFVRARRAAAHRPRSIRGGRPALPAQSGAPRGRGETN